MGKTDPWSQEPKAAGYPQQPKPKPAAGKDPWSKQGKAPDGPASIGGMPQLVATSMTIVVQRCISATLASDESGRGRQQIGPGLVISVCMAEGATEEGVTSAAKFVLTSKLSGRSGWSPLGGGGEKDQFGGGAESVVTLCKSGIPQGILVVPQRSLAAEIQDGRDIHRDIGYARAFRTSQMYDLFVATLRDSAPELIEQAAPAAESAEVPERKGLGGLMDRLSGPRGPVAPEVLAGDFGCTIYMEMKSAGPFMHSFAF